MPRHEPDRDAASRTEARREVAQMRGRRTATFSAQVDGRSRIHVTEPEEPLGVRPHPAGGRLDPHERMGPNEVVRGADVVEHLGDGRNQRDAAGLVP